MITDLKRRVGGPEQEEIHFKVQFFCRRCKAVPEWLEIAVRSLMYLIVLFVATKILGKKQIFQLSFFEYVSGIMIGDIASEVIMGLEGPAIHGILAIAVVTVIFFLAEVLSLKSKKFRDFMEGKGTIFIEDGKIMEENLKKERYTADELLELLRQKNVFQVADVEFAVLEASSDLSVLLKKENKPLTAKDLGIKLAPAKEPKTVIMDGKILDVPLSAMNLNRGWLKTELDKQGVTINDVFLGQVDSNKQLTVDLFDDKRKVPTSQ